MSNESAMRDLFDRWERVWHEGQYDLIPSCVGPTYIRHDEKKSDRTVTREAYAVEIAQTRQERPNLRFVVCDHSFEGDRVWFRFTLKFTDPKSGETRTRAGMQVWRRDQPMPADRAELPDTRRKPAHDSPGFQAAIQPRNQTPAT